MSELVEYLRDRLVADEPDYEAMLERGSAEEITGALSEIVESGGVEFHARAICLAGHVDSKKARDMVAKAASAADPTLRVACAMAARGLKGKQAQETLSQLLNDPVPLVRVEAVDAVPGSSANVAKTLRPILASLAENDEDAAVRMAASDALSVVDGERDESASATADEDTGVNAQDERSVRAANGDVELIETAAVGAALVDPGAVLPGDDLVIERGTHDDETRTDDDEGRGNI